MQNAKLTLSAEKQVIEKAKILAQERHTSISAMFSRFIKGLMENNNHPEDIGPLTRRATKIIPLPRGKTARQILEGAILEKHSGKK
jgi:hypothetical protein